MSRKHILGLCLASVFVAFGCAENLPETDSECQNASDEGKYVCVGNTLKFCKSGQLVQHSVCSDPLICSADEGRCKEKNTDPKPPKKECEPGIFTCEDKTLKSCNADGLWTVDRICAHDQTCDGGLGTCVSNAPTVVPCSGDDYCENNAAISCDNGQKKTEYCNDKLCVVNDKKASCVDKVCSDGEERCKDTKVKQKCQNNAWVDEACAGETPYCAADQKSCVAQNCTEGEEKCENNTRSKCENNAWKTLENCGSDKMCSDKQCVAIQCADMETRCNGDALERCVNNSFSFVENCSGICKKGENGKAACVELKCKEGAYQCTESGDVQVCRDNDWTSAGKSCGSKDLCDAATGSCFECTSGIECDGATLRECKNHTWSTTATCASADKCNATLAQCNECTDGEFNCNGAELQLCKQGKWTKSMMCDSADLCDVSNKTAGRCKPKVVDSCKNGEYRCIDNVLKQCDGTGWGQIAVCDSAKNETCSATDKQCNECTNGAVKCDGSSYMECQNKRWVSKKTCSASSVCDEKSKGCVEKECQTPGDTVCDGNKVKVCGDDYKYTDKETCTSAAMCYAESKTKASCSTFEWCNLQGIDNRMNQGYGRILLPKGLQKEDVKGYLACGQLSDPVEKWRKVSAEFNPYCDYSNGCGENIEFGSYTFPAVTFGEENYRCTFRFELKDNAYACLPGNDGGAPIKLTTSTKLTEAQTLPLKIPALAAYVDEDVWCKATYTTTSMVYSQLYVSEAYSPSYIRTGVFCTKSDPGYLSGVSQYEAKTYGKQNLYFTGSDVNWEYMTDVSDLNRAGNCVVIYQFGIPSEDAWREGFQASWEILCSKTDDGEAYIKNTHFPDRITGPWLLSGSDWIEE